MELLDTYQRPQKKVNIKKEIMKYVKHWYWILLSLLICYGASQIYLRYTDAQYASKTTLQFPESKTKGTGTLSDLQNLGTGLKDNSELQAEATAIVSKPILSKVVENLHLNIVYYGVGTIKEPELYTSAPITVEVSKFKADKFSSTTYIVEPINEQEFRLTEGGLPKGKDVFRFGQMAELPMGTFIFKKKNKGNSPSIKIQIRSTNAVIAELESSVSISLPPNKGMMMDLSMVSTNAQKAEDILNEITRLYNEEGVKDRNQEAQYTQDFINERLEVITVDLDGIEGQKEGFKRHNQITDIDAQANMALGNLNENQKKILELQTQLDLVNSIVSASQGDKLLPSNMGLNSTTEAFITKYNDLLLLKNKTSKQATALNPSMIELNKELHEVKNGVKQNLQETKSSLQTQLGRLQGEVVMDKNIIHQYPTQEKTFRSIERQRTLKEQLYLYLLQKREENAITLAVKAPKAKIINPAYTTGIVSPKAQEITMGALLLGLILPLGIIFGFNFFDTKIRSKEDVLSIIPDASVIGEIPDQPEEHSLVDVNGFSHYAESFRILASNVKFVLKAHHEGNAKAGVILVTSSIKGEGKTNTAMNLALTLAASAKTILIGADIRRPQLQRFVGNKGDGLTDYLIAENRSHHEFIKPSEHHTQLDLLLSGSLAPNPTSLLEMQKMDELVEQLKKEYIYIVIDSAPVMMVSDTLHLLEISDVVTYVIKAEYTDKEVLNFVQDFKSQYTDTLMTFVLNAVKPENTTYHAKYGEGYYQN